jgi:hypothetical protein
MKTRLFPIFLAIFLSGCGKPKVESIPDTYLRATQIWSDKSRDTEVEVVVQGHSATIHVSPATSSGTSIQYSDEQDPRDIYEQELYFGAVEVKYDDQEGIIYLKISGSHAAIGYSGTRIIEYDARKRSLLRDYWVELRD